MTNGLEILAEQFKNYTDEYVIIGGTATSLLLDERGLSLMRITKDIDMVIIVEKLSADFGREFWQFIKDGGYKVFEKKDNEPQFFRFIKPSNTNYPVMIELFSRKQDSFSGNFNGTIIPLHITDDISSLSVILLNDDYYNFLCEGKTVSNGISVLKATHLIPFKAKAWLDLSSRKKGGQQVNSHDITKHQNDVFKLSQLLLVGEKIKLLPRIKTDMSAFLKQWQIKKLL